MKELLVDGKTCFVFAERNDRDGGILTNVLVPAEDGSYYNCRTWEGRGLKQDDQNRDPGEVLAEKEAAQDAALSKFEVLTDEDIAARAAIAVSVSGSQQREEVVLP